MSFDGRVMPPFKCLYTLTRETELVDDACKGLIDKLLVDERFRGLLSLVGEGNIRTFRKSGNTPRMVPRAIERELGFVGWVHREPSYHVAIAMHGEGQRLSSIACARTPIADERTGCKIPSQHLKWLQPLGFKQNHNPLFGRQRQ